jgi:hypothetical protein
MQNLGFVVFRALIPNGALHIPVEAPGTNAAKNMQFWYSWV